MSLPLRVTRGPDWPYDDQDGGRNHVGTVIAVNDDHNVTVRWDMGSTTNCRVGLNGKHDVLQLDSSHTGIHHPGIECVRCENGAISGALWKCNQCKSATLCTPCYYSDGHLTTHTFSRINYPGAEAVSLPKRSISQRARALGIYHNAEVTRGPDWSYADQDGGSGQRGVVDEVSVSGKGVWVKVTVKVKWNNGNTGAYRLGQGGKVDLTCVEEAPGPDFYSEHLAYVDVAGLRSALASLQKAQQPQQKGPTFTPGAKVCVAVSTLELKQLRKGQGFTRQLTGEVGVVKKTDQGGEVVVDFNGAIFSIPPAALRQLADYKIGDSVKVVDSRDKVQLLQTTRGGWTDSMSQAIGKVGKVTMVDEDGDVVVNFSGKKYVFHPACLEPNTEGSKPAARPDGPRIITKPAMAPKPVPKPEGDGARPKLPPRTTKPQPEYEVGSDEFKADDYYHKDSQKATEEKKPDLDSGSAFDGLAMLRALMQSSQKNKESFLQAVVDGKDATVKQLVALDKTLVKLAVKNIPCLALAAHMGHTNVVIILADAGADLNATDDNGNTAMLQALSEQKGDCARVLIEKGANVNICGNKKLYPLHIAVHKNMTTHMRMMLKKGANPNVQDEVGDTPLHDAIVTKNDVAADILIDDPRLNVFMTNNKDFTTLAMACLKQHNRSVDKLLSREPNLANVKMEGDGYYPLHICAVNNHVAEAKLIFTKGRTNVNSKNVKLLTPLHMATLCAHIEMVQLLLAHNAEVNVKDSDGDTPLHLCVKGRRSANDALMALLGLQDNEDAAVKLTMAKLLIDKGADADAPNNDGLTPVTSCTHIRLRELIRQHANERDAKARSSQVRPSSASSVGHSSSINQSQKCLACQGKIADTCFMPCGHQYACIDCARDYKRCPHCRRDIRNILNLRNQRVVEDIDCKVQ